MPVSKRDLVDDLRGAHPELTRKQATAFVNDLLATVAAALKRGDSVRLLGFGSFDVRQRAARTGVNPTTKQPLAILHFWSPRGMYAALSAPAGSRWQINGQDWPHADWPITRGKHKVALLDNEARELDRIEFEVR